MLQANPFAAFGDGAVAAAIEHELDRQRTRSS
jgi:hypothetical protein